MPSTGLQCLNPPIIPIISSSGFFCLMDQKLLLSSMAYSIMRKRRYLLVREGGSVKKFIFLCKCFHHSSIGRMQTKLVLCFVLFLLWLLHCSLEHFLLENYSEGPISGLIGPWARVGNAVEDFSHFLPNMIFSLQKFNPPIPPHSP